MSEKQENNQKVTLRKIWRKGKIFFQNGRIIHFEKIWKQICLLQIFVSVVSGGGKS